MVSEKQEHIKHTNALRDATRPTLSVQDRMRKGRRICFSAICYANEEQPKHSEKKTLLHLNLHFKYHKCFVNAIPHYACCCAVLSSTLLHRLHPSPQRDCCVFPAVPVVAIILRCCWLHHLSPRIRIFTWKCCFISKVWSDLFLFFHLLTFYTTVYTPFKIMHRCCVFYIIPTRFFWRLKCDARKLIYEETSQS